MMEISLTLPSGEQKTVPAGTTVAEALKELVSNKERKQTIAARLGDSLVDLSTPIEADAAFMPITVDSPEA
ncbi:MAG: TGS domain-containing protein, partial [Pseudomonadota bacterium]